jgi:hypothetical protein
VLGFACGELVADAILGRQTDALALLDPGRPRLRSAASEPGTNAGDSAR